MEETKVPLRLMAADYPPVDDDEVTSEEPRVTPSPRAIWELRVSNLSRIDALLKNANRGFSRDQAEDLIGRLQKLCDVLRAALDNPP